MATSGEIIIKCDFVDDADVVLYKHSDAYDLPLQLANALERGSGRWDDAPYLARIIFCELIKDDVLGTTGAGIQAYSTQPPQEYLFVIDCQEYLVHWNDEQFAFGEWIDKWIDNK